MLWVNENDIYSIEKKIECLYKNAKNHLLVCRLDHRRIIKGTLSIEKVTITLKHYKIDFDNC